MYTFHNLTDIPITQLHETFLEAFSDYQIQVDMPLERLQNMLIRRGFHAEASLGAFEQKNLVGFLFHGLRYLDGKLTAYDTGTAVIPDCRKQGITTSMLKQARELLPEMGVERWLLEVLCENENAKRLYEREGFTVTRVFDCYSRNEKSVDGGSREFILETHDRLIAKELLDRVSSFLDHTPSWQNSIDSLCAVPEGFACVTCREGCELVGYGIVEKSGGDIPQIGVKPSLRRKGLGSAILERLAVLTDSESMKVTNVDSRSDSMRGFLLHHSFSTSVSQYEMCCDLS